MRLDADLIQRTPTYLNPLKDRELDLRGHKIPAIENLGVLRDGIDSLDLTDNSISSLSNFPLLRRLQHIQISNNPIRTISPSIATSLPNLRTLIITNGAIPVDSLAAIGIVLGRCRKLETLCLKGNPVTEAKHYKEWISHNCKKLRSLDYERIKEIDKTRAKQLFVASDGSPTALASDFTTAAASATAPSLLATNGASNTFEPGVETANGAAGAAGKVSRLLSKEEKQRIRAAIEAAESVEEIRRLQRMLQQGFVPTERDLKELAKKSKSSGGKSTNGQEMQQD